MQTSTTIHNDLLTNPSQWELATAPQAMHANHLAMQHQQQFKNRQYAHTISHTTVYSQCIHNWYIYSIMHTITYHQHNYHESISYHATQSIIVLAHPTNTYATQTTGNDPYYIGPQLSHIIQPRQPKLHHHHTEFTIQHQLLHSTVRAAQEGSRRERCVTEPLWILPVRAANWASRRESRANRTLCYRK